MEPSGQIIRIYKEVKLDQISYLTKALDVELKELKKEELEKQIDANEEMRDPYGYRGVKKSDFF